MFNILSYLSDCLWVLVALVRGKILRQRAYRLAPMITAGNCFSVAPIFDVTSRRMKMLMWWYGLREATVEELYGKDFWPPSEETKEQCRKALGQIGMSYKEQEGADGSGFLCKK